MVSVFGVILVQIFPHFPAFGLMSPYSVQISPYSVRMRENAKKNTDQNNSEYGHFLHSAAHRTHVTRFSEESLMQGVLFTGGGCSYFAIIIGG